MESPQGFVEEIDVQELSFHEVVFSNIDWFGRMKW